MSTTIVTFNLSQLRFVGYMKEEIILAIPSELFSIFPEEYRDKSFDYEDDMLTAYVIIENTFNFEDREDLDYSITLEINNFIGSVVKITPIENEDICCEGCSINTN